jgi:Holliday junction resolvase
MGKASRDKGNRKERELVNDLHAAGIKAMRVPLSGATDYAKGDVDVYVPWRDAPLIGEAKARTIMPEYLFTWLGDNDFLALKADRKDWLIVLSFERFKELLKCGTE